MDWVVISLVKAHLLDGHAQFQEILLQHVVQFVVIQFKPAMKLVMTVKLDALMIAWELILDGNVLMARVTFPHNVFLFVGTAYY